MKKAFEKSDREQLVDIYADEGITGTREDKRDEFQRMISDCLERQDRQDIYKVYQPICPKHQRLSEKYQRAEKLRHNCAV